MSDFKTPIDMKKLQEVDPLKRLAEKQSQQAEFSPMDPPDPYSPPSGEQIPYEKMPPFIQELMDEHQEILQAVNAFEKVLQEFRKQNFQTGRPFEQGVSAFFAFLDQKIVAHNLREEKHLFALIQSKLLEKGLHSQAAQPVTAVDMLEDDHIRLMQLAAVTFNFLGLAARLPDPASRALTLDAAVEQGMAMVEMLRLHIFREENVVYPLAVAHFNAEELEKLNSRSQD
jgi:hemerythrin-like domain-containing protein